MAVTPDQPATTAPDRALSRRAARLCAVQALYQIVQADATPDQVLKEFISGTQGRLGLTDTASGGEQAVEMPEPDAELLVNLVRAALDRPEDIRSIIHGSLSIGWPPERLEVLLECILRASVAELLVRSDIPPRVTISEFVEIAKSFYAGPESGMVNAVLDKAARALGRLEAKNG
jgi:N utilization substance protein B